MAESAERSSTISVTSAAKRRASKSVARPKISLTGRRVPRGGPSPFFYELARVTEMSLVERRLRALGFRAVAGTDEVGRGCLAGPVVAAAVVLPCDFVLGVNDSKVLHAAERRSLCSLILSNARAVGIGVVDAHVIDRINILEASKRAMQIAVEELCVRPEVLLLDAVVVDRLDLPQVPLIDGDQRSASIAAASIVAKVYRDGLMESYHDQYPQYDFANNRGYGTESHWKGLERFGPSPIHRRSFEGVGESMTLFD